MAATSPQFVVGEFWDSLAYDGSVPNHDQDAHRQRTVNWLNSARGGATAFDVTSKGILHAVFEVRQLPRQLPSHPATSLQQQPVLQANSC